MIKNFWKNLKNDEFIIVDVTGLRVTCQVNKITTFSSNKFLNFTRKNNIVTIRLIDSKDTKIREYIKNLEDLVFRNVIYGPDNKDGILLLETISNDIVVSEFFAGCKMTINVDDIFPENNFSNDRVWSQIIKSSELFMTKGVVSWCAWRRIRLVVKNICRAVLNQWRLLNKKALTKLSLLPQMIHLWSSLGAKDSRKALSLFQMEMANSEKKWI